MGNNEGWDFDQIHHGLIMKSNLVKLKLVCIALFFFNANRSKAALRRIVHDIPGEQDRGKEKVSGVRKKPW